MATAIVDLLNIFVNIPIEDLVTAKQNIKQNPLINIEDTIEKKLFDSTFLNTLLDTLLSDSTRRQKLRDSLLLVHRSTDSDNASNTSPNTLPVNDCEDKEKEDNTIKSTLLESSLIPINEDVGINLPDDEDKPLNDVILSTDDEKDVSKELIEKRHCTIEPDKEEKEIEKLPVDNGSPYVNSLSMEVAVVENKNDVTIAEEVNLSENTTSKESKKLTDKQKEVMNNISQIPAGGKFSYNSLAKTLGVSRSVLDNFKDWRCYFDFKDKQYIKK